VSASWESEAASEWREPHESAAHRDGSPYPLRSGHLSDPKAVGRTVSVSRKENAIFVFFEDFVATHLKLLKRRKYEN
jgi:hypothetical protein